MIKNLIISKKTRPPQNTKWTIKHFEAMWTVSGTWIAVSPNETIPEKYLSKIEVREDFSLLYNIPDDWKLIKLSEEDNNFELIGKAENDIYSIPGHRIIKRIFFIDKYLWGVASSDINIPSCYNKQILDKFEWIEKGGWKLVCLGDDSDIEKTKKIFKESLDSDIIFEDLF